jgi:hypothetical protein
MHPDGYSCNKIVLSLMDGLMDGPTVIFSIKCNVNEMLFLHGHLLMMLVIASLLFALHFLSV